jgi:hypothetical protein
VKDWWLRNPRPAKGVRKGLSRMRGNSHVRFLGGGAPAREPCYPTGLVLGACTVFASRIWLRKDFSYVTCEISSHCLAGRRVWLFGGFLEKITCYDSR